MQFVADSPSSPTPISRRDRLRLHFSLAFVVGVFAYALCVFLLYRLYVIGWMDTAVKDGILGGDPRYYETIASVLLEQMRLYGWQAWSLKPAGDGTPGIAAAIYAAFGHKPLLIAVFNAISHALSSLVLVYFLSKFVSTPAAIAGALPFIISPYQMLWFSQLNKDSLNALGVFVFALGLTCVLKPRWKSIPYLALCFCGLLFVGINRPYAAKMLTLLSATACIVEICWMASAGKVVLRTAVFRCAGVFFIAAVILFSFQFDWLGRSSSGRTLDEFERLECGPEGKWNYLSPLTRALEKPLCVIVAQRKNYGFVRDDPNETSRKMSPDLNLELAGTWDVLSYIPRAIALGLLAPFPMDWSFLFITSRSVFLNIVGAEMLAAYVGLAGAAVFFYKRRDARALKVASIALGMVILLGLGTPHIGALNRYRYAYLILIEGMGLAYLTDLVRIWYGRNALAAATA
jgi:hypothetical protein